MAELLDLEGVLHVQLLHLVQLGLDSLKHLGEVLDRLVGLLVSGLQRLEAHPMYGHIVARVRVGLLGLGPQSGLAQRRAVRRRLARVCAVVEDALKLAVGNVFAVGRLDGSCLSEGVVWVCGWSGCAKHACAPASTT